MFFLGGLASWSFLYIYIYIYIIYGVKDVLEKIQQKSHNANVTHICLFIHIYVYVCLLLFTDVNRFRCFFVLVCYAFISGICLEEI